MPKFMVGDKVERFGCLVPEYLPSGTVTQVIPNEDEIEWCTQYEVNFDDGDIATLYQTQLRLVEPTTSN